MGVLCCGARNEDHVDALRRTRPQQHRNSPIPRVAYRMTSGVTTQTFWATTGSSGYLVDPPTSQTTSTVIPDAGGVISDALGSRPSWKRTRSA